MEQKNDAQEDVLLTPQEVAKILRLKVKTLEVWRYRKKGPESTKSGGRVRYWKSVIDAYLKSNESGYSVGEIAGSLLVGAFTCGLLIYCLFGSEAEARRDYAETWCARTERGCHE